MKSIYVDNRHLCGQMTESHLTFESNHLTEVNTEKIKNNILHCMMAAVINSFNLKCNIIIC